MNGEREFIDGYRVARYKVYCANRQVVLGDEKIDLPWRCFEAFLVLIEANGEIVDREVFYRRLWPDVVVEESNLNQAIARLRKQLGDSGAESIIETVPRRGYRLLVRPERLAGKGPVAPTHVESPSWFRRWRIPLVFALILLAAAVAVRFGWQRWERRRQALALVEEGFRLVAENRVSQVAEANTRFSRAVELDPGLALGYAGLAEAMVRSVDGSRIHAKEMAERSLRIEPACAECQAIAGFILMTYGWRFPDALRYFRAAALKKPNDAKIQRWHAQVLACSGKLEQALQQIDRAVSLQPTDAAAAAMRAGILYFMGRYEEAMSAARFALGLRSGFTSANDWIYRAGFAAGRIEEALEAKASLTASFTGMSVDARQDYEHRLNQAYSSGGVKRLVETLLAGTSERLALKENRYDRASLRMRAGDAQGALDELEHVFEWRPFHCIYMAVDPVFEPIRNEPRFRNVLARIGLDHVLVGHKQ